MRGKVERRRGEKRPWKYIGSNDVADDESCPKIDEPQTIGRRRVFHKKGPTGGTLEKRRSSRFAA